MSLSRRIHKSTAIAATRGAGKTRLRDDGWNLMNGYQSSPIHIKD